MEEIFWNKNYLEEQLNKKKLFEYETYKDYDIYDLFIDLLINETIDDYGKFDNDIIAGLFDYVNAIRDSKDSWNNTYYAFKSDTALEDFSNKFSSLELRLKIMYYINININNIWSYKYDIEFIENECCRIIYKTLNELEQAKYDYMPRPDFKKLLDDPNFLKEKTPSRRWREKQIKNIEDVIQIINTPVQEEAEEQMIVEQPSKQTEKPIMTTVKPEEEINKVNIGSSEEAVPQKVPNSEIFNLDFWGLDECYKMCMKIIKDSPKNRGKQMVLNKIMQNSSYFHCNALRHKDFAEELNRLQNKFKFTKADVDHAFGR